MPSYIGFVSTLPRNPVGKVLKAKLRDDLLEPYSFWRMHLCDQSKAEDAILAIARETLGLPVERQDNLFELGADPLSFLQIASRVNDSFGISVGLSSLWESPTVQGLARAVAQEVDAQDAPL